MAVAETTSPSSPEALVDRLRVAGCVFAEDEARLLAAAASGAELEALVARRLAGEPLEQILGWAELSGLRLELHAGVFVPRRRTELLVGEAVRRAEPGDVVVDLCCGSGAVGAAIAAQVPRLELYAVDVDEAAVRCARRNVRNGTVLHGDLFAPLPRALLGSVDLLVVNAPYVPSDQIPLMPAEARLHEPRVALDGGADGLEVHRRVAARAHEWLRPGGHLLVETSARQERAVAEAFGRNRLVAQAARDEHRGATVVVGRR